MKGNVPVAEATARFLELGYERHEIPHMLAGPVVGYNETRCAGGWLPDPWDPANREGTAQVDGVS